MKGLTTILADFPETLTPSVAGLLSLNAVSLTIATPTTSPRTEPGDAAHLQVVTHLAGPSTMTNDRCSAAEEEEGEEAGVVGVVVVVVGEVVLEKVSNGIFAKVVMGWRDAVVPQSPAVLKTPTCLSVAPAPDRATTVNHCDKTT